MCAMRMKYCKNKDGNFGDDLNEWIWDRLIPGWMTWDDDVTLLGVGTLVNDKRIAAFAGERVLVLGTGVGYGGGVANRAAPQGWDFGALRGPRSARMLGLPEELGLVDPAVMIADLPDFQDAERSDTPVFIPHWQSVRLYDWPRLCTAFGLRYVSPSQDTRSVIRAIAEAPLVIAESMHAAIFAESFRVPWIPIKIGSQFNAEKWIDVFESAGLDIAIPELFASTSPLARGLRRVPLKRLQHGILHLSERCGIENVLERVLRREPCLGDASELARRKASYRDCLEEARRKYA